MVDPDIDVIFSNATLPREYDGSSSNGALFPLALAAVGVVAAARLALALHQLRRSLDAHHASALSQQRGVQQPRRTSSILRRALAAHSGGMRFGG